MKENFSEKADLFDISKELASLNCPSNIRGIVGAVDWTAIANGKQPSKKPESRKTEESNSSELKDHHDKRDELPGQ